MGWKAGSFYRIKEKRTRKEAIKARASLVFRDWLTGYTTLFVKGGIYRNT